MVLSGEEELLTPTTMTHLYHLLHRTYAFNYILYIYMCVLTCNYVWWSYLTAYKLN